MEENKFNTLRRIVVERSDASTWRTAVLEWIVESIEEDPLSSGVCICGQQGLTKLFTILNVENGERLYPIGSVCVNQFGVEELDIQVNEFTQLLQLRKSFSSGEPVQLTAQYFSRALLKHLYEQGAFTPDQYNQYQPERDYEFMVDMFNKRNKENLTRKQSFKIRMLIENKIRPYVLDDDRV